MGLVRSLLLAISIAFRPLASQCENVTSQQSTDVIATKCSSNVSCGFGDICRDGICVGISETTSQGGERRDSNSTETTYKLITESLLPSLGTSTTRPTKRPTRKPSNPTSHSIISGNQEFAIALIGFSLLFINFCLVTFCLGRMKRRRMEQQRLNRARAAATQSSQASQTGGWDSEHVNRSEILNMGIDNFALNGELDAFSSDFISPQVRLPPYDFSSAYHKPRPMTEEDTIEVESPLEVTCDDHSINEDPPPYSDQQFEGLNSPPSYDEALTGSTNTGESSSSRL